MKRQCAYKGSPIRYQPPVVAASTQKTAVPFLAKSTAALLA